MSMKILETFVNIRINDIDAIVIKIRCPNDSLSLLKPAFHKEITAEKNLRGKQKKNMSRILQRTNLRTAVLSTVLSVCVLL